MGFPCKSIRVAADKPILNPRIEDGIVIKCLARRGMLKGKFSITAAETTYAV
jgi:hypothetical protein